MDVPLVAPHMFRWARERADKPLASLVSKFPRYDAWEAGEHVPTMRQLESFAKYVYVPFGYLLLPEPPSETLPIQDFRTIADDGVRRASANLIDTLDLCLLRQDWYREYLKAHYGEPLYFVGSANLMSAPEEVAAQIRDVLDFPIEVQTTCRDETATLRAFSERADANGILVMRSGVVGNNTHRPLDVDEFRGFTLVDDLAPLIFINASDAGTAQLFTLAHELAHIWLGVSVLCTPDAGEFPTHETERWCNQVAAELLVPAAAFEERYDRSRPVEAQYAALARIFKVSRHVMLRRCVELNVMTRAAFRAEYSKLMGEPKRTRSSGGGSFFRTLPVRTSKRFAHALLASALEGGTLYRDAMTLLAVSKSSTITQAATELGL